RSRSAARLAVAVVAVVAAVGGLTACGRSEERDVRDALEAFAEATAAKDYQRLCDELFASALVEQVRTQLPCEVALRNSSLEEARDPKLEIRSISVDGDRATAVVRSSAANQESSEDTVELVKEDGEWRIMSL